MSCLFSSLSHFIEQTEPQAIRQRICDYLHANLPIIDGMTTHEVLHLDCSKSSDQYIVAMRGPSTWGGAIEIQAACNIWNARIIVHDIRGRPQSQLHHDHKTIEFLPISTTLPDNTFELEWSGGHYEPRHQYMDCRWFKCHCPAWACPSPRFTSNICKTLARAYLPAIKTIQWSFWTMRSWCMQMDQYIIRWLN